VKVSLKRIVIFVVIPILLIFLVRLGMWQLHRAEQGASIYEQFDRETQLPALDSSSLNGHLDDVRFRWIELQGKYLSSRQFLLDSMTYEGQAGYHVLTPFAVNDGVSWVLVNRGWVLADPDRRVLPEVSVSEIPRVIRGMAESLPQPGLSLSTPMNLMPWPQVVLFPSFEELEIRFEQSLIPYQLLLDSNLPDGFSREWKPRALPPERHIGYAIQWFSFAGVLAFMVIALWARSRTRLNDEIGR